MATIKLQADTGKYVIIHIDNGQKALWAIGNQLSEAAELEYSVVDFNDQQKPVHIQFKVGGEFFALNGETVVLDNGEGVAASRNFEIYWLGINQIALRAANGKIVSREKNDVQKLTANRNVIGPWEVFTIV